MYHKNFGKEYFKHVQRERRKNDPLYQKKVVYVATVNGKKYAFLQKSQLKVERMSVKDFKEKNNDDIIKCF